MKNLPNYIESAKFYVVPRLTVDFAIQFAFCFGRAQRTGGEGSKGGKGRRAKGV